MNHITNINPALAIFDKAYSDFDHCFNCMGFNTIDQWSFEFEIGAINCLDVLKSFNPEQLQELYDVVRLDAFARAQCYDAYNCADDLGNYSQAFKYGLELGELNNARDNQLIRFKIMAMENLALATDSYAMDFTL